MNNTLDNLINLAIQLGASGAKVIESSLINVEESLAALCSGNPPCEQFSRAPSCPPHVAGPSAFRSWQKQSKYAIVVKIEIPSSIMFSEECREVMQLLHEIVAGVEKSAKANGFYHAKAFAGGSCKNIWCFSQTDCTVLSNGSECRHPDKARPSMSGFGIDVTKLMNSAGWNSEKALKKNVNNADSISWIAGLILL